MKLRRDQKRRHSIGLLIDLDGVIYQQERPVPGALDAIGWLDANDIPYAFVTNTTSRPRRLVVEKLVNMGIAVVEQRILTPAVAANRWLTVHGVTAVFLLLPDGTKEDFPGLDLLSGEQRNADAVVVGDLGLAWTAERMKHALQLLLKQPAPAFLALGTTRYWLADDGFRLDVGAYVKALEHASGRSPVVLGKPSADFF